MKGYDRGPMRVLLVEDDPSQRLLGRWCLERGGLEVATAVDGPEGLELALGEEPDAILLDLVLTGFSGLELLRRYRAGGGQAPVVVLSGWEDPRLIRDAQVAGATFFLTKPADWNEVICRLRSLARGVETVCEDLLSEMGAPRQGDAFFHTARCAALLAQEGDLPLKCVYVEVVGSDQAAQSRIEIGVRRLVARLHRANTPAYRELLARTGSTDRPTNRVFLTALAQTARIRL